MLKEEKFLIGETVSRFRKIRKSKSISEEQIKAMADALLRGAVVILNPKGAKK